MQKATFTKTYTCDVTFDENDLTQIIGLAINNQHISFKDRQQYEDTYDSERNLIDIFKEDGYNLKYLGIDNLNYHLFSITNEKHAIELVMSDELFRLYYTVN